MKFNPVIPELSASDLTKSLRFYRDVLGFRVEYDRPSDKFSFLSFENIQIMIEQVNGNWETAPLSHPYGRGINFQMEIQDTQSLIKKIQDAGIKLFKEPEDVWYEIGNQRIKQRQFLVVDPDGYLLRFCQRM